MGTNPTDSLSKQEGPEFNTELLARIEEAPVKATLLKPQHRGEPISPLCCFSV